MKALVIGGSGFIGGHIIDRLKTLNADITVYDVVPPKDMEGIEYVFGDILDVDKLKVAFKWPDVVYHLAGISNTEQCMLNPSLAVKTNCVATTNILNACLKMGAQRVIIAGTSLIGSLMDSENTSECVDVLKSNHIYTSTKLFQEMITRDFTAAWGLDHTIFRFGICYGPRMTPGVVVHNFIRNALNGKPMLIHGSGEQTRPYIYVHDLADACISVLGRDKTVNKTYNIVPYEFTSIKEIAETITSFIPEVTVEYTLARSYDFNDLRRLGCENLTKDTGWWPKTTLEKGIKATIDYYRGHGI